MTTFCNKKTDPYESEIIFTRYYYQTNWCRGPESNRYESLDSTDFKSVASACSATPANVEAAPRIELGNKGFADLCLTAWLCRHNGAGNEIRTRDPRLGKAMLYH